MLTRSICCYCGVGCGVLIETEQTAAGARIVGIEGDPEHPANYGKLCTKGRALPQTVQSETGRALHPELRLLRTADHGGGPRERVSWDVALDVVTDKLATIVNEHGPDSVAFYLSGQLLTEDYYVFNKLAKGLIGTNNVDTNSRLCMSSAVTAYKKAFGADGPPTCYDDLEAAQTVLFAGSNMAYAHPVLFQRLLAAKEKDPGIRWIVIDPRRTDTAAMADLHLAIQPGTDVALFNGMLHYLIWEGLIDPPYISAHTEGFAELKNLVREYTPRFVAELCGIQAADLIQAAEWFARSPATLSLYCMGLNQSVQGTDKNLALIHLHLATGHIGRPGAGPFSLTGQPNAMGGREVGGLATMLAAHREIENAEDRAELERLWGISNGSLSPRRGLAAVDLFAAVRSGRVKAIWIVCTNPVHSMPDIEAVRDALTRAELVIVQEAFAGTDTVPYADVLLPAASWGEKDGTMTNSERRISRVRAAVDPVGEARPDWWIANEVARRLQVRFASTGSTDLFPFTQPAEIFAEHCKLTVGRDLDIGGLDYAWLEAKGPQQWPFPASDRSAENARRYADGVFVTASGRARFHNTSYKPVADAISSRYPLRLLSGRLRDQWHGMSRTGRAPSAFAHTPEATLTMHPDDAARRGLAAGDLVRITSKRGAFTLQLSIADDVCSGSVFAAMHWNAQFLASGGVNEVTTAAVDAQSLQPELKHAAVRVEKVSFGWHVLAARHGDVLQLQAAIQPLLRECAFAAVSITPNAAAQSSNEAWITVRAANDSAPVGWLDRLVTVMELQSSPHVLEYRDVRRGLLKKVAWRPDTSTSHIHGLLLTATDKRLLNESLLTQALSGTPWIGPRLAVFSQSAGALARPRDTVICNCMQVAESTIQAAIADGADLIQLKSRLGCGSVCGSCTPQLLRMVQRQSEERLQGKS